MTTKSPTTSVKSREMIGVDQFSQRREVFDKHDTVFLPLPSPTALTPVYRDVEPIITSNHGKTTNNFKRNTHTYSSMRESKTDERIFDFRPRKYSDNFTSELNQSDDVDYRYSSTERTRRLSKLRRDFLTSNLHDPSDQTFTRSGMRASMPVNSTTPIRYKIESPNLYKFPFAEPFSTPPPVRRVFLDLGPSEVDGGKENQDPELRKKYQSLQVNNNTSPTTVDHQKLFEQLLKRYSPQRKPVDWTLPPTRPRVVGSVPKSTSSMGETQDINLKPKDDEKTVKDDEVFEKEEENSIDSDKITDKVETPTPVTEVEVVVVLNGPTSVRSEDEEEISKRSSKEEEKSERESASVTELEEKNDHVTDLPPIQRQLSKESPKRKPPPEKHPDLTIPALIHKITADGETLEHNAKSTKKVKRKRSFLDKLLGRKKDK